MKSLSNLYKLTIAGLITGLLATNPAYSAVNYSESGSSVSIPGLTGFATNGAMMDGMTVIATFDNGVQTGTWGDTGATSGGVSGNGWSLSLSGDSFTQYWSFSNTRSSALISLKLDGSTGLTVFDRTFGDSIGTPGSASGWDFEFAGSPDVDVTYLNPLEIGTNGVVGDIFQAMLIEFDGGIDTGFRFGQDTDNDSRFDIPEPGSLALLGAGLLGLGFSRRRKS